MIKKTNSRGFEVRKYPGNCTSAFCGRGDCTGCKWLAEKQEFDRWRDEKKAVKEDPIWSPLFWTATVK